MTEKKLFDQKYAGIIAGVDEAGRGPMSGPVIAAAVIITNDFFHPEINDSKKITAAKREKLYQIIIENNLYAIGSASVQEIDQINILNATKLAMSRAISALNIIPDTILIDGNMKFDDQRISSIIKGDQKSLSIAAASIIAKVTRDNIMLQLHEEFPQYEWRQNMGYGTKAHIEAIKEFGLSIHHRQSFKIKSHLT